MASKIVNYVRKSVLDTEVVQSSVGFKLPTMNATRWNSQHRLLQKLIEALDTDPCLQQKLKACSVHSSLKPSQIKMLKELVLLLEPFKVTTELFKKSAETVGLVIPCIMEMRKRSSCD